jgi:Flp pilus assembly pilin Flp
MNVNVPAHRVGRLTVDDLDSRQRERAAALEIAAQLEREAHLRWQTRRVLAPPTREEDDANGVSFARGVLLVIGASALVAACVAFVLALDWLFKALP